jgi:hypothetical protein
MKMIKTLGLTLAVAGAISLSAHAVPITGSVDMNGTVTLDNVLLGSATAASSFSAVVVGGTPTGSYTGTGGSSVTWSGFSWTAFAPVAPLWTFTSGLNTYTFDLNTIAVVSQNNSFLNLKGTGALNITGPGSYDPTFGDWSFTISNAGGGSHANFQFTFANSQTAAVPDGGTTVMLLGAALSGLGLIRRKLVA